MSAVFARHRTPAYKPLLSLFCGFALLWTICLLYAGGFTTSIRAGMAFLDWPLSNGSINPDGWLTEPDKMAEHSHRLLAAILGCLTLVIAGWLTVREERSWLRRLGWVAVALVIFQGLLGGGRVLLDRLNTGWDNNLVARSFAIAHACTAQIFVCVLVSIAVATTRRWIERTGGMQRAPSLALLKAGGLACGAIFVQVVLGAVMRHSQAGLAMPTFPLTAEGGLLPADWNFRVAIHFAHRAWAVVVTVAMVYFAGRLWAARHLGRVLGGGALWLMALLALQVYLGALVIWTLRNPYAATVHMLMGAFVLASTWGLTFLSLRFRFAGPAPSAVTEEQPALHSAPDSIRA